MAPVYGTGARTVLREAAAHAEAAAVHAKAAAGARDLMIEERNAALTSLRGFNGPVVAIRKMLLDGQYDDARWFLLREVDADTNGED